MRHVFVFGCVWREESDFEQNTSRVGVGTKLFSARANVRVQREGSRPLICSGLCGEYSGNARLGLGRLDDGRLPNRFPRPLLKTHSLFTNIDDRPARALVTPSSKSPLSHHRFLCVIYGRL